MTNIHWLFDVDGTLTPSRQRMTPEFEEFFVDWMRGKTVSVATGSDYDKLVEQVPESVLENLHTTFCCSGNHILKGERTVKIRSFSPTEDLINDLCKILRSSKFPFRTGKHVERRFGCMNFSVVGRNASREERDVYSEWDSRQREREYLAKYLESVNPEFEFHVGGETGIDIFPRGKSKAQIRWYISFTETVYFFGDRMSKGGNDYPLVQALREGDEYFPVKDWKDTMRQLGALR